MRTYILLLFVPLSFLLSCKKTSSVATGCSTYSLIADSADYAKHLVANSWQLLYTQGGYTSVADTGRHYPTESESFKFYSDGTVDITNGVLLTKDHWTMQNIGGNTWVLYIHTSSYGIIGFCAGFMELNSQFVDGPKSVYKQIN